MTAAGSAQDSTMLAGLVGLIWGGDDHSRASYRPFYR